MKKYLIILCIVLGLAAVGGIAYRLLISAHPSPGESPQFSENLQAGRQLLNNGVGGSAVSLLEQAVSQAGSPAQKARAEVNLGAAYVTAGMVEKGVDLWKRVSLNEGYPAGYRSTAAQDVVSYYVSVEDIDFALAHIFSGPGWGAFMNGQTPDPQGLNVAVRKALTWIDSFEYLNPSFVIQYRLASWYGGDMLTATGTARDADVSQAQHYLEIGDTAYQKALAMNARALQQNPNDLPPYVDSVLGTGLMLKGRALGAIYLMKVKGATFDDVVSLFKQSIALLERGSAVASFSRFHLAEFLELADPIANKQPILDALTPIYASTGLKSTNFYQGFLRLEGVDSRFHNTAGFQHLQGLARIDPRFKSLLSDAGWKSTDLE